MSEIDVSSLFVLLAGVRACVIGPEIIHRASLLTMLRELSVPAISAVDSHSFRLERDPHLPGRARRAVEMAVGTRDARYMQYILDRIDASGADVAVFYWGTLPLPDIVSIKRARPRLKIVLMLLCYPLALHQVGILRQQMMLLRTLPLIDGLICPTEDMARYLGQGLHRRARSRIGVVPPCWPAAMMPTERPAAWDEARPNVVYVGRTDISGPTAHSADDTRDLLNGLMAAGIVVHHGHSRELDDGNPLRMAFPQISNDQLVRRMAAHDASLVAYNTAACQRSDRFDYTVPDRLISSAIAGVPVALPAQGYAASKSYLQEQGATISFESGDDLFRQLADRDAIARLKELAWAARVRYVAEKQAARFGALIASVVDAREGDSLAAVQGAGRSG